MLESVKKTLDSSQDQMSYSLNFIKYVQTNFKLENSKIVIIQIYVGMYVKLMKYVDSLTTN